MGGHREVCETIANRINVLGDFCGIRDVPLLNKDKLVDKYGFNQADVMVLFGWGAKFCEGGEAYGVHRGYGEEYWR